MNVGVHQTHCCDKHGCKYADPKCPVVKGKVKQEDPCETCSMHARQEGGFYDRVGDTLKWRPPISEIIERVAKQLGPKGRGRLSPSVLRDLNYAAHQLTDAENEEFLTRG